MTILGTINLTSKPPDDKRPTRVSHQNAPTTSHNTIKRATATTTATATTPTIRKIIITEQQTVPSIVPPTGGSVRDASSNNSTPGVSPKDDTVKAKGNGRILFGA